MFPLEPYANFNDLDGIRETLEDSNAKTSYPKAHITDAYLNQIRENFNKKVDILVDILMADYTRENISKESIIDTAKRKKIHYFLKHDAGKIFKKVINRF